MTTLMRRVLLGVLVVIVALAITVALLIYVPIRRDRSLRAEVDGAMGVAAAVEESAGAYIRRTRAFPPSLAVVDIPSAFTEGPVSAVAITGQGIELTLRSRSKQIDGRTLVLDARLNDDGSVAWSCGVGTLDRRYQPQQCHSAFFE
jgi:hypothetical protein